MKKQNYKESKLILEKINKAKKILLNCHRGPDPDTIGSATAMYQVLTKMGKDVRILCPSDTKNNFKFIPLADKVETVDFSKFDFSSNDLFIAMDSSSWEMVSDNKELKTSMIPIIVIDHHKSNTRFGDINLVDDKITSTAELLYLVFEDWKTRFNKEIANSLLSGVIADTGAFRYPKVGSQSLEIGRKLMELGADKDYIVLNVYHTTDIKLLKFWAEVLLKARIDKERKFFWCAIPYEKYEELGKVEGGRESSASEFAQIVAGTDFGFVAVEQEKEKLSISFRSRTGFDTSLIAKELGGGGHIYASGARVWGLPFNKAVQKVLETARKFAKEVKLK